MNDLARQILRRVRGRKVVIVDDFADLCPRARVSRALANLAKAGTLRRIGRGLYDRPQRSPLLPGRTLPPEFGSILAALERQQGVTLRVSPLDAARYLGLELGVQVLPVFATSGRRRNVQVAGWRFQLVPPAAWARPWMHRQGFVVLQALAYLGPDQARDPEVANTLGKSISRAVRRDLVAGWTTLPQWVREALGRALQAQEAERAAEVRAGSDWMRRSDNGRLRSKKIPRSCDMRADLTLALDIEGTLIVSAGWPWSRPGLKEFLEWCREAFGRVVFFTTVPAPEVRQALDFLVSRGEAPAWVLDLEVWNPLSEDPDQKDLARLGDPARIYLVDDFEGYAVSSQRDRLVAIANFDGDPKDRELARVREELERRIQGSREKEG